MPTLIRATIDDLYNVPNHSKAELVNGELLQMSPSGYLPGNAAHIISSFLFLYRMDKGGGHSFGDNVGFLVELPNRQSFSPDAGWFTGPIPDNNMKFINGAPDFAVEVRSEGDYGPAAETAITRKIEDYFVAGTLIVWDVDLLSEKVIKKFSTDNPTEPVVFKRGEIADAEPAVPGWTIEVDVLFK